MTISESPLTLEELPAAVVGAAGAVRLNGISANAVALGHAGLWVAPAAPAASAAQAAEAAEAAGIPVEHWYRFSDATAAEGIHKALARLVDPARSTVPDGLFDRR